MDTKSAITKAETLSTLQKCRDIKNLAICMMLLFQMEASCLYWVCDFCPRRQKDSLYGIILLSWGKPMINYFCIVSMMRNVRASPREFLKNKENS